MEGKELHESKNILKTYISFFLIIPQAVFKLYIKPGSFTINGYELRDALGSAGYRLNLKILNALVHRYGSKDGKMDFDDFVICAIKVKTMMDTFKEKDTYNRNRAEFTLDEWIEKSVYS